MADKPMPPTFNLKPSPLRLGPQSTTNFSSSIPSATPYKMEKSTMAPIGQPTDLHAKKPLDISNLMSPPELPRYDSFSQRRNSNSMGPAISDVRRTGPVQPLSPPISPAVKIDEHLSNAAQSSTVPVNDPILYPTQDVTGSPQQGPLFTQDDSIDVRRIVDDHVSARPANLFREATPPKQEDYELMLFFSSQVMKKYSEDPKSWLKRERGLLLADRRAGARSNHFKPQLKPIFPAKPQEVRKETQRVKTTKPAKVVKTTHSTASAPRPIRSYPASGIAQQSNRLSSVASDSAPRRAVAPNREDKDFESLPDFCPPKDALPDKANSLKVDWKGTPIDLSSDANRDRLHPDEVTLAANLRLDCATYLTSKRRMFIRRRECLDLGKEFRKTDAQQACKIDVNKASKLWTAFDKVGWLDKKWMDLYKS